MPNASEASFKIDILIISAWKELSLAFADERLSNACIEAFENCVPLLSGFWNGVCLHHSYKKAACLVHHSLCLLFKCQQVKEAVTISLCCFNIIVFTDVVIHNIYQICLFCFVCSIHVQRSHSPASDNYLCEGGGGLLLRAVTWGKAAKASQVRCFAAAAAACLWSKHGGNILRLLCCFFAKQ